MIASQACVAAGRWVAPAPTDTLEAAAPDAPRIFGGARLALHGPPAFVKAFGLQLKLAGAVLSLSKKEQSCSYVFAGAHLAPHGLPPAVKAFGLQLEHAGAQLSSSDGNWL